LSIAVSKRRNIDPCESEWILSADGVTTAFRYLRYEDIVRRQWPANAAAMFAGILRYSWHFLRMGVFRAILRNSWANFLAVTYPLGVLLGSFALSLLLGLLVAFVLRAWIGDVAFLAIAVAMVLPFALYRLIEKKYNAFWLARSCTFLVDRCRGHVPGIEERCLEFAKRVAAAVNAGTDDEVMLVGHSVGTHIAVTVAARALEQIGEHRSFSLLTLGHAIAMTPAETTAQRFRADLVAIATSSQVEWIDVTSAVDGSCIALSDPLEVSGIARPDGVRRQPKLVSARFNKLFSPQTYATIRRDFLRTHFQYLMAAELAGDYDYFLITAGDMTLAERFAHLESVKGFDRFRVGKK
jgi:pimeloyl-ACP methyl ester carboxylesterase